jgi:hypothetical protein
MSTTEQLQTQAVMIIESDIPPNMSIADYRRRRAAERRAASPSLIDRARAAIALRADDRDVRPSLP